MNDLHQDWRESLIADYDAFLSIVKKEFNSQEWMFRGHSDANWRLSSSLERALDSKKKLQNVSVSVSHEEQELLTQFKKRAFHYISDTPDDDDELEWLALMQHHG